MSSHWEMTGGWLDGSGDCGGNSPPRKAASSSSSEPWGHLLCPSPLALSVNLSIPICVPAQAVLILTLKWAIGHHGECEGQSSPSVTAVHYITEAMVTHDDRQQDGGLEGRGSGEGSGVGGGGRRAFSLDLLSLAFEGLHLSPGLLIPMFPLPADHPHTTSC